jgi:hypothetical protein
MLFGLLDRDPFLDETTANWMFDVYRWVLRNFDPLMFRDETILVTPPNAHFPGRANSSEAMAQLVFERVVSHAGMAHWPLLLLPPDSCETAPVTAQPVVGGTPGPAAAKWQSLVQQPKGGGPTQNRTGSPEPPGADCRSNRNARRGLIPGQNGRSGAPAAHPGPARGGLVRQCYGT